MLDDDTLYTFVLHGASVVLVDLLTPHPSELCLGGQSAHSGGGATLLGRREPRRRGFI